MAARDRRRRSARREGKRGTAFPQPASQIVRGILVTRLGVFVLLLLGFWIGRAAAVVPGDIVEFAVALISAVALALWYRRRARQYMQTRAASRGRAGREQD